jgi:hypothetical protein
LQYYYGYFELYGGPQDVARLREVVDGSTKEIRNYATQYEDQRVIVEALGAVAQADPANKPRLDILVLRERLLEDAHVKPH